MFSTLCDRLCEKDREELAVGVTGRFSFSGEGGGELWGACERGRSALRRFAYGFAPALVSSEAP
jgi:hypothetical protein